MTFINWQGQDGQGNIVSGDVPIQIAASTGQSPVALTPLDGEVIAGGVQSNFAGNGFYTRHGLTRARDWVGPKPTGGSYAGFDDPAFLPIATWLTDFVGTSFYDRMDDLGLNGMLPAYQSVSLNNNVSRGKWAVVVADEHPGGTITTSQDPGVVGVLAGEEPWLISLYNQIIADNNAWLDSSDGPGRMGVINYADHILNGDIEHAIFPDSMVTSADWVTCDQYWFAGAGASNNSRTKLHFRMYQISGTATTDQCARGSHYGSMMDCMRKEFPAGQIHPTQVWIETGAPYSESNSLAISPAQIKWAVWATLVHGARGIGYFCHTFRAGDPLQSFLTLNDNRYGGPGIAGNGVYAAVKEVNRRALQIATVINSPTDGYFAWGDLNAINQPGFLTAVMSTNSRGRYSGVDARCKWEPVEQKHYILSTTRESGSATNIPATYRMVDQGQTAAVEVFEGYSRPVNRGGSIPQGFCEFTDTFATAASYHTYRID